MNYTITSIDGENINVIFDVDGVEQCLSGMPLDNVDTLNQALFDYGQAYQAGLEKVAQPVVAPEVEALVGQSVSLEQTIDKTGVAVLTSSVSSIKATPALGGLK